MRTTSISQLAELQKNAAGIRNICILAHVDHGKTTLADTLVASNGIISQRMAGKLRYLDSREDEQLRGITMKSSAIALHYSEFDADYIINLIDSPGHIDFSSEVSTAVRLCDGAIVLVDVVEGVSPQTHAVLRQAWLENIKPILILNKIDRLITELKMSPIEAHLHLQQILEQVNVITAELFTSEVLQKSATKDTAVTADVMGTADVAETADVTEKRENEPTADHVYNWSSGLEDTDDSDLYFSPDIGNVLFASAIDGWGFSIQHFAKLYAAKLGFKVEVLNKTLWGDFYLETKTKRIKKGAGNKGKKPLFVQFILENLWAVYDAVLINRDVEKIEKIVKSMKLKIAPRDARHSDPRVHLQAVAAQWLPLSKAVLSMVIDCLPSPLGMSEERVEKLLCSNAQRFDSLPAETQKLKDDFISCNHGDDAPVIVYVSKMFTVDWKTLPQNKQRPLTIEEMEHRRECARQRHALKIAAKSHQNGDLPATELLPEKGDTPMPLAAPVKPVHEPTDQVFIAFARVFSGTVKPGCKLYVLGPKHDPAAVLEELEENDGDLSILSDQPHIEEFIVGDIYLVMGRELEALDEVPAGNILGLGGLDNLVLKTATLSSTVACSAFTDMYMEASPIVRVALEPVNPGDMKRLVEGLRLLNQADPCVRVMTQTTGEHVIMTAGEVHLQKCLDDLRNRYAKVEVNVSPPIVPFRETIITPPKTDMVNEVIESQTMPPGEEGENQKNYIESQTANKLCTIRVQVLPLPDDVTQLLEDNADLITALDLCSRARTNTTEVKLGYRINQKTLETLREFRTDLLQAFEKAGDTWSGVLDKIWSFGPKRNGPNLLINRVSEYNRPSIWSCLDCDKALLGKVRDFDNSVVSGFQMAALAGPLCEEPMRGVCYILQTWDLDDTFSLTEEKITGRERKQSERLRRTSERIRNISGVFEEDLDEESVTHWQDSLPEKSVNNQEISSPNTHTPSHPESPTSPPQTAELSQIAMDSSTSPTPELSQLAMDSSTPPTPELSKLAMDSSAPPTPELSQLGTDSSSNREKKYGPFTGQLMSCMKEACRRAYQTQPQRLMAAMYSCIIQAEAEVLGKLYGVLGKRNGRILQEDLREGTSLFNITAVLPVIESFGFAEDIRKKTSGLASPQLKFSHWEVIDLDPFWVPTTDEEYLHYGDKADSTNRARTYMDNVRRRKGLKVDDKLVEFAEKQRTLTRNK